jgi:LAO/AO transport system kinase
LPDVDVPALLAGDHRTLAKAITLVESTRPDHRRSAEALLEAVLPVTGKSWRVGVSGSPGSGKSTFIEALGTHVAARGRKVAVLAVDPSSPRSRGSILGDKTRMPRLAGRPDTYIRPSPSAQRLGGVTHTTRESILFCEAAGFDTVFVETVGAGQSEYEAAGMVDFLLVLVMPNAGDDLQGMKRGLMELADAVIVNKADGALKPAAGIARVQYEAALRLMQPRSFWEPPVLECSSVEGNGIEQSWTMIEDFFARALGNGQLATRRAAQRSDWLKALLARELQILAMNKPNVRNTLLQMERQVVSGETTPHAAVRRILQML